MPIRWNVQTDNDLLKRFEGQAGKTALLDALASQILATGSPGLAEEMAGALALVAIPAGVVLIEQGGGDNDVYVILAGSFAIEINGRRIADRGAGECVS